MFLLVKIFDAVNLICGINSEWNAVQTFTTDNTSEALRMIWFASGSENSFQYWFLAYRTLFQCVQIIILTIWLPIQRIEWLSLQINLALMACEAANVVNFIHGCATGCFTENTSIAFDTNPVIICVRIRLMH